MAVQLWEFVRQMWVLPDRFGLGLLARTFLTPDGKDVTFNLFARSYPFVTSAFALTKPALGQHPAVILVRQFRQGPGEAGKVLTELPGSIGLTDDEFGRDFPHLSEVQWEIVRASYGVEEVEFFEAVFGNDLERRIAALLGPFMYQTLRRPGTDPDVQEFLEIEARIMATAIVELFEEIGYVGVPLMRYSQGARLNRDFCAGRRWSDANETVLRSWATLVKCVKVGEPESGCECLTIPVPEFLRMQLDPNCEDGLRTPSALYALLAAGVLRFDPSMLEALS